MLWQYAIAVLLGTLLLQFLPQLPPLWLTLLVVIPLLVASRRYAKSALLPAFCLMFAWTAWLAQERLQHRLPESLAGKDIQLTGTVSSLPEVREAGGQRFRFKPDSSTHQLPAIILLRTYRPDYQVQAGERWRFTLRMKPPHGFQNPGGFDYEAYLFRQNIGARGYVRKQPAAERLQAAPAWSWLTLRAALKQRVQGVLEQHVAAPLVVGLLVGDRSGLQKSHWKLLQHTGTAHLMAISGLHIGMVAGFAYLLLRWLWALSSRASLFLPAQKAAAIASLAAALIYAGLAGFSIPTQRALIMLTLAVMALLANRPLPFQTLFSATLIAVLLWDPFSVLDTGFWLSFVAVAIIAWAMTGKRDRGKVRQFFHVQLAVSVGLLPLVMARFQLAPWLSPLANLLAVPLFTFAIVPMILLSAVLMSLPITAVAGESVLLASAELLAWLWSLLESLAGWHAAYWAVTPPSYWALLCAMLGVICLLAPPALPGRWLGLIWLLPLFVISADRPAAGDFRLVMLDVGQGLAVHIQTASHDLVFDTGPSFGPSFDTGAAVVLPYLRQAGVDRLDTLVISHGDNDHAGGSHSVIEGIPVMQVLTADTDLPAAQRCRAGHGWQWDGVKFDILHPGDAYYGDRNNAACVLRVTGRGGSALLPADIERRAENILLDRLGTGLKSDILIAPHHGSKTSSSQAFLETVKPGWILIPAGYRNRYRHPHPLVLERYQQAGASILSSAAAGAVRLSVNSRGVHVSAYREQYQRYWHHRPL